MARRRNTDYDPKYPWRPMYYFDRCPQRFEQLDFGLKCDNCGQGHDDYDAAGEDGEI